MRHSNTTRDRAPRQLPPPPISTFFCTSRFKVSGTNRSAKPARNDQIISSAYATPLAGPVPIKNSFICKTPGLGVATGDGDGDAVDSGLGVSVGVSVRDSGVATGLAEVLF